MDSLYSEMHDNSWCMREFPSRKNDGKVFYCGQRIPRGQELCQNCENEQNKEK